MTTLAAWLHDLSPFLAEFGRGLGLRWYGLAYAAGFLVGWGWLRWMSKRGMTPLGLARITDAMLYLVLGVVVGGRLGYVFFYDPALLWTFSPSFPWWGLLQLNHGGMASHGGIIGVIGASYFIARGPKDAAGTPRRRVPWLHVIDLMAVTSTPGLFLGRIANFINGELLGQIVSKPGEAAPWWAVRFPQERLDWWRFDLPPDVPHGHAPVLTADQGLQLQVLMDQHAPTATTDMRAYEVLLNKLQSGGGAASQQVAAGLEPLIAARHPSQLYQAAAEGLVLAGFLWLLWAKPRRPGVIGAWFLIGYGVMRITTEVWRLPDADQSIKANTGLSTGQWLSVAMVLVGAIALVYFKRQALPAEALGGWRRGKRGVGGVGAG